MFSASPRASRPLQSCTARRSAIIGTSEFFIPHCRRRVTVAGNGAPPVGLEADEELVGAAYATQDPEAVRALADIRVPKDYLLILLAHADDGRQFMSKGSTSGSSSRAW
jgi:hypothetical protein